MEVILLENIERLGTRGQIVKVADGYGRNYLLPKKMAVAATQQNRKWVDQQRVRFLKLEAKEKADAEDLSKLMQDVTVSFTRKAGEQGTLFGSVTAMDVADSLASQGYRIDRRKIQLGAPLKVIGEYDVPIKLHRDVTATIKLKIEGEFEPGSEPAAESEAKSSAKSPAKSDAKAEVAAPAESPATPPATET